MCKTPSIFGAGQPPDHSIAKARMLNVRYSLRALRQIRFAHLPQRPHLRCDFARPERKEECEKYTKIIFTTPSPQMLWLRQVRKERGVRKIHKDHFYNALTSDVVASPGQKGKRSAKMRAAHFRTPLSFLASAAGARKRHIDGELTHTISWMNKP